MTRPSLAFIDRVIHSHLGHLLLAISWSFILFVLFRLPLKDPQFVNCVSTGNEFTNSEVLRVYPIWIGAMFLAHFPSIIATIGITELFQAGLSLSCAHTAGVELSLFALFSAIQWFVVGYIIESVFRQWRSHT